MTNNNKRKRGRKDENGGKKKVDEWDENWRTNNTAFAFRAELMLSHVMRCAECKARGPTAMLITNEEIAYVGYYRHCRVIVVCWRMWPFSWVWRWDWTLNIHVFSVIIAALLRRRDAKRVRFYWDSVETKKCMPEFTTRRWILGILGLQSTTETVMKGIVNRLDEKSTSLLFKSGSLKKGEGFGWKRTYVERRRNLKRARQSGSMWPMFDLSIELLC